jgi:multidrug efflux system outer membrane protein
MTAVSRTESVRGAGREVRGARCGVRRALILLAACGISLFSTAASAQTPVRTVEFADALREALEKNPTVGQAALAVTRADALVAQARALTVPSFQVAMTNTTLDSERGFSGGVTQPQNQFAFTGSLRYTVGGFLAVNQARDQAAVATASSAQARQGVAVAAAQAYLAVIASRRQIEVAERALATARAHFDYADRRASAGVGSELNRLRASQVVTTTELQVESARLAERRAREALAVVLAAEGPVTAGREPVFDVPATVDETTWMSMRPDLVTEAAIKRAAERVVRQHWQEWAPLPTLSFDPQVITPSGLFQPSRTWRFTISMVQPVFDGGARRATLRVRQAAVDQSTLAFSGLQIRARSEVRVAEDALASLARSLASARAAVTQSADVLRITTTAFEVGATTNIEVIDAQRALRDAETAVATLEDAERRARLDLLVAVGRFPG